MIEFPVLFGDGVTDDTAAIQARLDSGASCVYLPPPEKAYLISKTLLIGSGQELKLDRYSEIRLAPQSNCPMIQNKCYLTGLDRRISLTGGIWDMANVDQSPNPQQYHLLTPPQKSPLKEKYDPDIFFGCAMRFSHVDNMSITGLTVRNPTSYGMKFCHSSYMYINDISFDYTSCNPIFLNMDGVHLDGHCHHAKISNLRGTCYDDLVALNANDISCAQDEGPITDIDVDGVYADYCHSAVRMLSTGADLERVTIRNVHGNFYVYAVGLTHFFPERGRGRMDHITIENVFTGKEYAPENIGRESRVGYPLLWVDNLLDIGSLTIRNFVREEKNIGNPSIVIEKSSTVKRLTVRDCKQINRLAEPIKFYDNRGKVETELFENNEY